MKLSQSAQEVPTLRFKSRAGNRLLKTSQLGFLRDRLRTKLNEQGYHETAVNPDFSSIEWPECGFVARHNLVLQKNMAARYVSKLPQRLPHVSKTFYPSAG